MFNLPFFKKKTTQISTKPTVLVIMDGFGIAPASEGNAIKLAQTPNYNYYSANYPHTELIASGESVGLPANEVGNTEVGHLTLGAGRVIYQDLKRINMAIENGSFYDNRAFLQVASFVRSKNSKLHIFGLVGSGGVHSSIQHLLALLQFCKKEELTNVYLHIFTDGRDSAPNEGIEDVQKLEAQMKLIGVGKIASISGRYYAMDRDRRWERTERAYNAIVLGQGNFANSAVEAIQASYNSGKTDEFIEPTVILTNSYPTATVGDGDGIIFYNFRVDRPRQLTMAFVLPDFENLKSFDFGYDPDNSRQMGEVKVGTTFKRLRIPKEIFFVTMTEYQKNLPVSAIAFGPLVVENALGTVFEKMGLQQLHMAESEKERFVTYYFNGMREKSLVGEDDVIVPSPKVSTYDLKPEMSLPKLANSFIKQISKGTYSFAVINFANPDMVGHTGNLKATVKAIEVVDKYLGQIVPVITQSGGTVFLTADHGNAEELVTYPNTTFFYTTSKGSVNTEHSNNPVPLIIINELAKGNNLSLPKGALSDVAPTILGFMGIKPPSVMTGRNLLR